MTDLNGATCKTVPRDDIARDPGTPAPVYVDCGASKRPSGAVAAIAMPLALPKNAEARHAVLEKAAAFAPAGRDAAARMSCRAGQWTTTSGGIEMTIKPCTLDDGGWPEILVVAPIGNYLFQADGLPALLPALQAVMLQQAGFRSAEGKPAFGNAAESLVRLKAAFGGRLRLIAADDVARFSELVERARLDDSRKDFPAAEDAYREALDIQTRAFGPNALGVGMTLIDLALEVSNQERFAESAALFRRADPIIEKLGQPVDRARFFNYMAFDAANAGRFADALAYARQATSIWRDLAGADTPATGPLRAASNENRVAMRGELAHSLNTEAAMALRLGNLPYALSTASEALEIVGEEHGLPPWWRPEILTTLGEVYAAAGRLGDAEKSLRGALIYQERLFGNTAPTAATLLALGRIYVKEELYENAIRSYNFAIGILEKDATARSEVAFDQIAPLITAINALAKKKPNDRAAFDATVLRALQLMGTSVTDQTISLASARVAARNAGIGNLVDRLQDAERKQDEARIELANETSEPDDQRGAAQESALLRQINGMNALSIKLNAEIESKFPAYARLANPGPVALAKLQRRLKPREGLLLIEIGRFHAVVILVRAGDFVARPIDLDRVRADEAVRSLRRALKVHGGRIGDFDLRDAYRLYKTIFGPVKSQLADIDHLIVIPSGALASLPVSLLVTRPPTQPRDYVNAAWLVRRFSISVAPSIRAFLTLRDEEHVAQAPRPFLGIGDPAFEGHTTGGGMLHKENVSALAALSTQCRNRAPIPRQMLRALAPLPDTASEIEQVAHLFGAGPGDELLGAHATETALRAEPLDQFRVLYFATHGLLPGELSCQSEPALALSPPAKPAKTRAEDGLLDASEIAGLRLNADLVVLSACNTAQEDQRFGGQALSGLAGAFFYAGARGVVASHWQVPSAATVALMVGMFRHMGPNMSGGAAEALRQSQLALIAQPATAHPFFWAAFTVIGDGGSHTDQVRADRRHSAQKS
ncbi:MAG: CHAT domain-containing protein [Alphaproteobacteria bacterium]|nr:CHAT domain-containing protein [Alphaproteobacteria bacterium]